MCFDCMLMHMHVNYIVSKQTFNIYGVHCLIIFIVFLLKVSIPIIQFIFWPINKYSLKLCNFCKKIITLYYLVDNSLVILDSKRSVAIVFTMCAFFLSVC